MYYDPPDEAEYKKYLERFNKVWFDRQKYLEESRKRPSTQCPLCPDQKVGTKFYCRFHARARTANLANPPIALAGA